MFARSLHVDRLLLIIWPCIIHLHDSMSLHLRQWHSVWPSHRKDPFATGPFRRGAMKDEVWEKYIKWLWDHDLLTTGMQSRHPDGGRTFSLARPDTPLSSDSFVFTHIAPEYFPLLILG